MFCFASYKRKIRAAAEGRLSTKDESRQPCGVRVAGKEGDTLFELRHSGVLDPYESLFVARKKVFLFGRRS